MSVFEEGGICGEHSVSKRLLCHSGFFAARSPAMTRVEFLAKRARAYRDISLSTSRLVRSLLMIRLSAVMRTVNSQGSTQGQTRH